MRVDKLSNGYIVMLPGVDSRAWQFSGTEAGLREAGIDRAVDVVEWGDSSTGSIENLTDLRRNQERAKSIAFRIAGYQRCYPAAPVTLVGYSGGGGLAVLVAEALPEDVELDRMILIGAAISPDHDMRRALARCRRGIVNYYSANDWFMLGVGTRALGTIDRKKTDSAGRIGFRLASGELRDEPELTQIAWRSDWRELGHNGSHVGWLARPWAREVLAQEIEGDVPTGQPAGDAIVAADRDVASSGKSQAVN